jgi:hypothetical protein
MENRTMSDVGGTPGGLGEFLLGFAMTCVGGFLITNQVKVVGSYWSFYGAAVGSNADDAAPQIDMLSSYTSTVWHV